MVWFMAWFGLVADCIQKFLVIEHHGKLVAESKQDVAGYILVWCQLSTLSLAFNPIGYATGCGDDEIRNA